MGTLRFARHKAVYVNELLVMVFAAHVILARLVRSTVLEKT
jgi:hypothetical protein